MPDDSNEHDQQQEIRRLKARLQALRSAHRREKQKRQGEQAPLKKEWLELIMRYSNDGINIVEYSQDFKHRRLIACNERYVEMSGRARHELFTDELWKMSSSLVSEEVVRQQRVDLSQGKPSRGMFTWNRPDGKENYNEWTGTPIVQSDGKVLVIGIDRDTTDRRIAEKKLQENQERFNLIMRHSSDGINITTIDLRTRSRKLLLCNDRFVEMSGRTRQELMECPDLDLFADTSPQSPVDRQEIQRCIDEQKPFRGIGSWKRPDGKENVMEWTAAPIPLNETTAIIIGIDRDITERKLAEEALQKLHRQLLSAREMERQRLARELHDSIGQQMVALHLTLQGTLYSGSIDPASPAAAALTAAAERCNQLIRDVRNICHGLYPTTLEQLGLVASLRQLAIEFKGQVAIVINCQEKMEEARLPMEIEIEIFRIVQEAVNNAIRHGRASEITISILEHSRGEYELTVTDNGCGFNVARATGGIGLSTIRERAEAIGGKLKISSSPGKTIVSVKANFRSQAAVRQ